MTRKQSRRTLRVSIGLTLLAALAAGCHEFMGDLTRGLSLEFRPAEWSRSWADGDTGGTGGETLVVRVEGDRAAGVDGSKVFLWGPKGTVSPVSTNVGGDRFEAEFLKIDAIRTVEKVPDGETAMIKLLGKLQDGTFFKLAEPVTVAAADEPEEN